jgi:hypothetical protein
VDGGVGFGRNAVELVRPGEWTSAPVESRMMEEERSGVLGVLVEDWGREREDGSEFEEVGALGGGDEVGDVGDEGLEREDFDVGGWDGVWGDGGLLLRWLREWVSRGYECRDHGSEQRETKEL